MKTKKKYKHSKAGLLICLLSLHTLSSCVHTAQKLGTFSNSDSVVDIYESEQQPNLSYIREAIKNQYTPPTPWYKSKPCLWTTGVVASSAAISAVMLAVYCYLWNPSEANPDTMMALRSNNDTALANGTSQLQHNLNTSVGYLISDLTTTAATVFGAVLNTTIMIGAWKPNGSNVDSNSATATPEFFVPTDLDISDVPSNCKSFNIEHPLRLTQEVINDLKADDFSIETMKCKFHQGLNVDAKDEKNGCTLLMAIIRELKHLPNPLELVRFLVNEGHANVNAQDGRGNTPLEHAIHRFLKAKDAGDATTQETAKRIIDFLVRKGANPCISNIDKKPSFFDIKSLNNKKLSNTFKKCWTNNIDLDPSIKEQDGFIK